MTYFEAHKMMKTAFASGSEDTVFATYWNVTRNLTADDVKRIDRLVINSGYLG